MSGSACKDCGQDAEVATPPQDVGGYFNGRFIRTCPICEEPICRDCANKDPIMSELCRTCSKEENERP